MAQILLVRRRTVLALVVVAVVGNSTKERHHLRSRGGSSRERRESETSGSKVEDPGQVHLQLWDILGRPSISKRRGNLRIFFFLE